MRKEVDPERLFVKLLGHKRVVLVLQALDQAERGHRGGLVDVVGGAKRHGGECRRRGERRQQQRVTLLGGKRADRVLLGLGEIAPSRGEAVEPCMVFLALPSQLALARFEKVCVELGPDQDSHVGEEVEPEAHLVELLWDELVMLPLQPRHHQQRGPRHLAIESYRHTNGYGRQWPRRLGVRLDEQLAILRREGGDARLHVAWQ
mmetsp:Transcript_9807/g.19840  ORF Transcript_9807/g.19840 Transcript_9807/m.19840 type:complete len:204 (-) Transcript_9807:54-665(-)